jgi:hypothetical protein
MDRKDILLLVICITLLEIWWIHLSLHWHTQGNSALSEIKQENEVNLNKKHKNKIDQLLIRFVLGTAGFLL